MVSFITQKIFEIGCPNQLTHSYLLKESKKMGSRITFIDISLVPGSVY